MCHFAVTALPEGDPAGDLCVQHESATQEHVGAKARVPPLQADRDFLVFLKTGHGEKGL